MSHELTDTHRLGTGGPALQTAMLRAFTLPGSICRSGRAIR